MFKYQILEYKWFAAYTMIIQIRGMRKWISLSRKYFYEFKGDLIEKCKIKKDRLGEEPYPNFLSNIKIPFSMFLDVEDYEILNNWVRVNNIITREVYKIKHLTGLLSVYINR